MLSHLLTDSAWIDRKLDLATRHHLERTQLLERDAVLWLALKQAHRRQQMLLDKQPFDAQRQVNLIKIQAQDIQSWRQEKAFIRQEMRTRQQEEMAQLEQELQA